MVKVTDSDAKALAALVFAMQTIREETPVGGTSIIDYALTGTSRESLAPDDSNAEDQRFNAYGAARNQVRATQWNAEHFRKESLTDLLIALGSGLQERAKESPTLLDQLADLFSRSYHQQNRLAGTTLSKLRAFFLRPDESANLERIFAEELKCASCGVDLKPNETLAFRRAGRGATSSLSCSRCEVPQYVRCSEPGCQDFQMLTSKMRSALGSRKCEAHRRGAVEAPVAQAEQETMPAETPALDRAIREAAERLQQHVDSMAVWTVANDPVNTPPPTPSPNSGVTGSGTADGRAMVQRWAARVAAAAPMPRVILPSDEATARAFDRMYTNLTTAARREGGNTGGEND